MFEELTYHVSGLDGCKDENGIPEIRRSHVCDLLEFISRSAKLLIQPVGATVDGCSKCSIINVVKAFLYVI